MMKIQAIMTKEKLEKIIRKNVEDIWYNRRSINPVEEQTRELTDRIWEELTKEPDNPEASKK